MGRETLDGPITRYIGRRFDAVRERHGTYDEIAAKSGVKRSTVVRACAGVSALSVEAYVPLALTFGFNPGDLLNEAYEHAVGLDLSTVDQTAVDLAAKRGLSREERRRKNVGDWGDDG